MVRLVFRPYTQLRRSICTSESLRSSIRISPDFNLTRHSSPSFGSQHIYSTYSQQTRLIGNGGIAGLTPHPSDRKRSFAFTSPSGLVNPMTRIHVRLLGPCFKTGRSLRRPTRKGMADRNRKGCLLYKSTMCLSGPKPGHQELGPKHQLHPGPLVQSQQFQPSHPVEIRPRARQTPCHQSLLIKRQGPPNS
jgi:hypothetical protein